MIAPDWFQFRWGPVLRKELTKRFYRDSLRTRVTSRPSALLLACRRVDEAAVCLAMGSLTVRFACRSGGRFKGLGEQTSR